MLPKRGLPNNVDICAKRDACLKSSLFVTNSRQLRFSSSWNHLLAETVALARPLMFVTLALFILCSSACSQLPIRPETGTIIKDVTRSGYGILMIHNNWKMDTVAVLADKN